MNVLHLVKLLNQQANEIASAGYSVWGNTMRDAADKIEEQQETIYKLENDRKLLDYGD